MAGKIKPQCNECGRIYEPYSDLLSCYSYCKECFLVKLKEVCPEIFEKAEQLDRLAKIHPICGKIQTVKDATATLLKAEKFDGLKVLLKELPKPPGLYLESIPYWKKEYEDYLTLREQSMQEIQTFIEEKTNE